MVLTISIPSDSESKLRERAKAAGQEVGQYVQGLIARELDAPLTLVAAVEPLAKAVEVAGLPDEFLSALNDARDGAREIQAQN